jgi:hypothetical protein
MKKQSDFCKKLMVICSLAMTAVWFCFVNSGKTLSESYG